MRKSVCRNWRGWSTDLSVARKCWSICWSQVPDAVMATGLREFGVGDIEADYLRMRGAAGTLTATIMLRPTRGD